MTVTHKIFHCKEFIKTIITERLDFKAVQEIFRTLIEHQEFHQKYEILIDLRQAWSDLTTIEILRFVDALKQYRTFFSTKLHSSPITGGSI